MKGEGGEVSGTSEAEGTSREEAEPGHPGLVGVVPAPSDPALRETVEALASAADGTLTALLLYGSHLQDSAPTRWSAYDFLVIVEAYGSFYRSLARHGHQRRPAWLLTALSHLLPPNVISFDLGEADQPIAKCAVFNSRHFRRNLGPRARDHFLKGRVVQKIALLWTRSPEDKEAAMAGVRWAREDITRWIRPYLPGSFDLTRFSETMLQVSYRAEIRPEHPDRVAQVFEAQKETLVGIARSALSKAVARGELSEEAGSYRWNNPPGTLSRLHMSGYFAISKIRATARWFKYVFTFEGWIDYVQKKVARRAGLEIRVKERERRWPLIFLWPKFFRVLRMLKGKKPSSAQAGKSMTNIEKDGPTS